MIEFVFVHITLWPTGFQLTPSIYVDWNNVHEGALVHPVSRTKATNSTVILRNT